MDIKKLEKEEEWIPEFNEKYYCFLFDEERIEFFNWCNDSI